MRVFENGGMPGMILPFLALFSDPPKTGQNGIPLIDFLKKP
jgi:hypothetical protein